MQNLQVLNQTTGRLMIEGIVLTSLKVIAVDKGRVFHALKKNDKGYKNFGEAYFSEIEPNEIKAWKRHNIMTLNLVVPLGEVRFVLFDDRYNRQTFEEITLSVENYYRLTIPPKIWFGFQGLSKTNSLILNIADIEHDPNEVDRKEIEEISYNWRT